MKPTTSASASSVKSTLSFPPALCNELAYSKWCNSFLMYLTLTAKIMNQKSGGKLDTAECEDAAMYILAEFDQEYKTGIYDTSISKPQTFKYRRLRDHITGLIREKEKLMRAVSDYAETANMTDEMFTIIPAAEAARSREAYLKKLYSILMDDLSESERKIVEFKAKGLKNQQIAEKLGISYSACTKRISLLRDKLEAKLKANGYGGLLTRV